MRPQRVQLQLLIFPCLGQRNHRIDLYLWDGGKGSSSERNVTCWSYTYVGGGVWVGVFLINGGWLMLFLPLLEFKQLVDAILHFLVEIQLNHPDYYNTRS